MYVAVEVAGRVGELVRRIMRSVCDNEEDAIWFQRKLTELCGEFALRRNIQS